MNKKTARIVLDIEWEEGHEHDLPSLWNWSLIKYSMDLTNVKYYNKYLKWQKVK